MITIENTTTDYEIQIEELENRISELESANAELDAKLTDAYKLNAREASMEAEKIRHNLSKSFTYLYDDWMEYKNSQVSENNYMSLQAILQKVFRCLERNGINYK